MDSVSLSFKFSFPQELSTAVPEKEEARKEEARKEEARKEEARIVQSEATVKIDRHRVKIDSSKPKDENVTVSSRAVPEGEKVRLAQSKVAAKVDRHASSKLKRESITVEREVVPSIKGKKAEDPKESIRQTPEKESLTLVSGKKRKVRDPKKSIRQTSKHHPKEESLHKSHSIGARFDGQPTTVPQKWSQNDRVVFSKRKRVEEAIQPDSGEQAIKESFSSSTREASHKEKERVKSELVQPLKSYKRENSVPIEHRNNKSGVLVDTIKPKYSFTIQNRKDAPYLEWIRQGIKKAEGRVGSNAFLRLKEGDTVQFHNRHEGILCRVNYLHRYPSFKSMVTEEGVRNLVPHVYQEGLSTEELIRKAVRVYESFPGSQRVNQLGAVAIGVTYLYEYFKGNSWRR